MTGQWDEYLIIFFSNTEYRNKSRRVIAKLEGSELNLD